MSWLDLLLCITKNTALWLVECDKFKTFLKCSGNPLKTEGDWGNLYKQICRHKEWTLTYYHSFLDLSEKFFHSKAFFFLVYSVYINVEKVYQRLLQCVAQLGNHWPRASDRVRQKMGNSAARKVYYAANYAIFLKQFNIVFLGLRGWNPFFCCPTGN